ncbi:MAG: hypothetical protein ACRECW_17125 [Phyllobacterium sp.]
MSRSIPARIGSFFNVFGSAVNAAAAVRQGRQPRSVDLDTLGIDPQQFRLIRQD